MQDQTPNARRTRKETQQRTRDRLMAAAHASIIAEGVSALSIRGICDTAGHSQGAFYSNFANKGDLLVDILEMHIHDEVALLRDLVQRADGRDVDATLRQLAAQLAEIAAEPQWSLLSIELHLHARRDPAFAERHQRGKEACYRLFGDFVADLVQRLALRPALPPHQAGIGLYALWMGLAVQGDVAGAVPRNEMLVAFFRAMTGLSPS